MIDYSQILDINYPGKQWTMNGDSYEGLVWLDESPKPTQNELNSLWETTKNIIDNKTADVNRRAAYVTESDPLFFKAQRGEVTIEEWQDKITEIKTRYPKSE